MAMTFLEVSEAAMEEDRQLVVNAEEKGAA
jgi:hypothetical protein